MLSIIQYKRIEDPILCRRLFSTVNKTEYPVVQSSQPVCMREIEQTRLGLFIASRVCVIPCNSLAIVATQQLASARPPVTGLHCSHRYCKSSQGDLGDSDVVSSDGHV